MHNVARLALGLLVLSAPAHAADSLAEAVRQQVLGGRYMSPPGGCRPSGRDLLGWPAQQLQECRYEVTDVHSDGSKHKKAAVVFLANPEPERVLSWLTTACTRARPHEVDTCVRKQARAIRAASGAQFPVAGLVWEDQSCGSGLGTCRDGSDGINEGYVFRNGVTVRVQGYRNGSTDAVSEQQLQALATDQTVTGMSRTGGFARVISTTRDEFASYTHRDDIPVGRGDAPAASAWSDIVGGTYRAALSSDDNPLIDARVCAAYGLPAGCRAQ